MAHTRSTDRTLESEDQTLDRSRPDPSLDVGVGDGLETPALPRLVVQNPLELLPGEAPADHALAKLQDSIFDLLGDFTVSHAPTVPVVAAGEIPLWG